MNQQQIHSYLGTVRSPQQRGKVLAGELQCSEEKEQNKNDSIHQKNSLSVPWVFRRHEAALIGVQRKDLITLDMLFTDYPLV